MNEKLNLVTATETRDGKVNVGHWVTDSAEALKVAAGRYPVAVSWETVSGLIFQQNAASDEDLFSATHTAFSSEGPLRAKPIKDGPYCLIEYPTRPSITAQDRTTMAEAGGIAERDLPAGAAAASRDIRVRDQRRAAHLKALGPLVGAAWDRDLDAAWRDGLVGEAWDALQERIVALCDANDGQPTSAKKDYLEWRRDVGLTAVAMGAKPEWPPLYSIYVKSGHGRGFIRGFDTSPDMTPESVWQDVLKQLCPEFVDPTPVSVPPVPVPVPPVLPPVAFRASSTIVLGATSDGPSTPKKLAELAEMLGYKDPDPDPTALKAEDQKRFAEIEDREEGYKEGVLVEQTASDVLWLLQNARKMHARLSDARWHMRRLANEVNLARLAGQGDEQRWRAENGVSRGNVPFPGDKCGHNRCLGILVSTNEPSAPHAVRCDRCAVRQSPGPGAAEALEAAEERGKEHAAEEVRRLEEELDQLHQEREEREDQLSQIHHDLGHCDGEWSNCHDIGVCAVETVDNMMDELRRLRGETKPDPDDGMAPHYVGDRWQRRADGAEILTVSEVSKVDEGWLLRTGLHSGWFDDAIRSQFYRIARGNPNE